MIPNTYSGVFIVEEGVEGGGKSTQALLLKNRLEREGHCVLLTQQPTKDGIFGQLVRFVYMCPSSKELEAKFPAELEKCLASDEFFELRENATLRQVKYVRRFKEVAEEIFKGDFTNLPELFQTTMTFDGLDHHRRVVIPALKEGTYVVSDRWRLSTPAYAAGDGLDWRSFLQMQFDILGEHFVAPDILFILRIPVEVGLTRTSEKLKGGREYFDDPEKMQRIERAYAEILAEPRVREKLRISVIDGTPDPGTVHSNIWKEIKPILR